MSVRRRLSIATFGYRGAETQYVEEKLSATIEETTLAASISVPSLTVALTAPTSLTIDLQENGLDIGANLTVEGAI